MARRAHEFLPKRPRRREAVRWHVDATDKAIVFGVVCKCLKAGTEGYHFQAIHDEKVNFAFTIDEYEALLKGQDFDLEPNGLSAKQAAAKLKAGVSSTKELASKEQMVVDLREIAVWKFQKLFGAQRTSMFESAVQTTIEEEIQPYLDTEARRLAKGGVVTTLKLPRAHEFLKWIRNYKNLGKLGLVPGWHRCGNHKDRYSGEVYALVMKHARRFLRAERPTRTLIYLDLKTDIGNRNDERRRKRQMDLPLPDPDYLSRQIDRLAPFDVDAARHLDEHAKRSFHPSKGGVPDLFRPMQRVEADDWDVHLHVLAIEAELWEFLDPDLQAEAEKTRCVLSVAICCVTRVLPAVVLSLGPSAANTAMLLRMCMSDKTPLALSIGCETPYEYRGNPYTLVGDEGSAILNARTRSICDAVAVEFLCPQIDTPQQRGKIERVLQTLEIRSLLRFSGRAFSNPQVRGKYQAEARACVTVAELAALLLRFIVDQYHNTPHDGLDGETPRHCWLRLTKKYAPRAIPGKPLMRRAFGEPYTIKLQPEGIEIFGNWYTSPAVNKLYREVPERDYTVIVDSEDLGGVTLLTSGASIEVPGPDCMNGISVAVWDMALASMRRENKQVEDMVEPLVRRAIGFAQEADAETRKRLGIRYRPKTPGELEQLRNSIGPAVRFAADPNPNPKGPVDIRSGRIAVGTKAPARKTPAALRPAPTESTSEPKSGAKRAKPKAPRTPRVKSQPAINRHTGKPPRQWKPKERK